MKMKIVYPEKLSEIPLKSYQEWVKVSEGSNDEEFLSHKFVTIFLGLKLHEAVQVRNSDMQRMINKLAVVLKEKPVFKQTFKFQGIEFGFIPNLEEMTWGEYIDIESNLMSWDKYHIALSVLYRPITKRIKDTYEIMPYKADEKYHDVFKLIPLDIALSGSVFFWNLEKELLIDTLLSLEKKKELMNTKIMTLAKKVNLVNNGDGITQFIDLLKGMSSTSTELRGYPFIKPLPSYLTKSKKIKSNITNKKEPLKI